MEKIEIPETRTCDAILSIHSEYAEMIKNEKKKYEFRKVIFKKPVRNIYLYVTAPLKKIVGWFPYTGGLKGTADEIWEACKNQSGIQEEKYFKYYSKSPWAYAIFVNNYTHYNEPMAPEQVLPDFKAPQSFCYTYRGQL